MTAAQYAAHRGCSPSYVWRLRRQDKIEECPCGEIDAAASDARLARELNPIRGGDRSAGAGQGGMNGQGVTPREPINYGTALPEAVRRERLAKARLAELELGELSGQLIRRQDTQRAVVTLVRQAIARMRMMASRLRGPLAATSEPRKCEALIEAEIEHVCADMQEAAIRLVSEPRENSTNMSRTPLRDAQGQ